MHSNLRRFAQNGFVTAPPFHPFWPQSRRTHDFLMKHNFVFKPSVSKWQRSLHEAAHQCICLLRIGTLFFNINVDMYGECHTNINSDLLVTCASHTVKCVVMETSKNVLKPQKVALCKRSCHVPHAYCCRAWKLQLASLERWIMLPV